MSTLWLCAAGNPEGVRLALEVNEANPCWDRIALVDDDPARHGRNILGVPVTGPFAALAGHQPGDAAVNLVARSTRGRDAARAKIEGFGIALTSLVHPSVNLRGAVLGRAVTLYEGCVISALAEVGDHAVVFTRAVLGHGAVLGAGGVLAPGAVVNARVRIGARGYVGANAAVLPDLTIGEDATISACSAVVGDIPAGHTALGVPAEILGGAPLASGAGPGGVDAEEVGAEALASAQTLFARALGTGSITGDTNFFDAGGTSKRAVELQAALRAALGVPVTIIDIFRFPSPRQLVAHLFGAPAPPTRPSRAELRRRRPR
ncbi:MAG TPA: hypothetical protein GX700_11300 [Paracoccus sp.]|nr:hypothetical protein [Paracoccus sp. (in: a-proteobacteria)]